MRVSWAIPVIASILIFVSFAIPPADATHIFATPTSQEVAIGQIAEFEITVPDIGGGGTCFACFFTEITCDAGSSISGVPGDVGSPAAFVVSMSATDLGEYQCTIPYRYFGSFSVPSHNGAVIVTANFVEPAHWDGGGDGVNWSDRFNWTVDTLPTGDQDIVIDDESNFNQFIVHLDIPFVVTTGSISLLFDPPGVPFSDIFVIEKLDGVDTLVIQSGGSVQGNIFNEGSVSNSGLLRMVSNQGIIKNDGGFLSLNINSSPDPQLPATIENKNGGTLGFLQNIGIINNLSGDIRFAGFFDIGGNFGIINNHDRMILPFSPQLFSHPQNRGFLNNFGIFQGLHIENTDGTVTNHCGGVINKGFQDNYVGNDVIESLCIPNLVSPDDGSTTADTQPDLVWENDSELRPVTYGPQLEDTSNPGIPIELVSLSLVSAEPIAALPSSTYEWLVTATLDGASYDPGYPFTSSPVDSETFQLTVLIDNDGDGFSPPADCDDTNAAVHPNATEVANGIDDNCDGVLLPEEVDNDGDGFAEFQGDCDDTNAAIFLGAPEIFNGIDEDCDGIADNGVTAQDALEDLIEDVEQLGDDGALNKGQENSLTKKLENIIAKLNKGNTNAACNQLDAFENHTSDFIADGVLTQTQGQSLIDTSNAIQNGLGCS